MIKPDRLEDLGRIRELLNFVLQELEDRYGQHLESKHGYEGFVNKINMKSDHESGLDDLHCYLRWHKEKLEDILCIAIGDVHEE